jgi:hypothetical protein
MEFSTQKMPIHLPLKGYGIELVFSNNLTVELRNIYEGGLPPSTFLEYDLLKSKL